MLVDTFSLRRWPHLLGTGLLGLLACNGTGSADVKSGTTAPETDTDTDTDTDADTDTDTDADTDTDPADGIGVLGGGTHSLDNVVVTEVLGPSDGLALPRDLEFHPDVPGQLWVVNELDNNTVLAEELGEPSQISVVRGSFSDGRHFLAKPSALAFGVGTGAFATIHEEDELTQGPLPFGTPADFMGPTLWTSDGTVFRGDHSTHLDMLHNSPNGVGIAWEDANIYWVFDGYHQSLTRYNFNDDHGLGGTDHSDGVITRFAGGEVAYVPDVSSHIAWEPSTQLLYVADSGNNRIAILDPLTGSNLGQIGPNYDGVDQSEVGGATLSTLIEGADVGMQRHSGLEIHDDLIWVSDNLTSTIFAFDLDGVLIDYLETDWPSGTLMGLAHDEDGRLFVVDTIEHTVLMIAAPN